MGVGGSGGGDACDGGEERFEEKLLCHGSNLPTALCLWCILCAGVCVCVCVCGVGVVTGEWVAVWTGIVGAERRCVCVCVVCLCMNNWVYDVCQSVCVSTCVCVCVCV